MTKVMSHCPDHRPARRGGAPNPKIPIPQRPLEGHVVIPSVKPSALEQNVHFPMPPEVWAHEAYPTVSAAWDPPGGTQKANKKRNPVWVLFLLHFGAKKAPRMSSKSDKKVS